MLILFLVHMLVILVLVVEVIINEDVGMMEKERNKSRRSVEVVEAGEFKEEVHIAYLIYFHSCFVLS